MFIRDFIKNNYNLVLKSIKKKTAALLIMSMVMQTIFSGYAFDIPIEDGNNNVIDLMENTTPNGAFSNACVEVGKKVNDDQTITLKYYFKLQDEYTAGVYEDFLAQGGLDYGDYFELDPSDPIKQKYSSYDLYLDDQSYLPDLSFTCAFEDGYIDIGSDVISGNIATKDSLGNVKVDMGNYSMQQSGSYPVCNVILNSVC